MYFDKSMVESYQSKLDAEKHPGDWRPPAPSKHRTDPRHQIKVRAKNRKRNKLSRRQRSKK